MAKRESLYAKYPDYKVELVPNPNREVRRFAGRVVADSTKSIHVLETNHDPVVYFPRADVDFEVLTKTTHETFCPFKGEASYWRLEVGGKTEDNVIWGYDDPFEEVAGLVDYIAFYEDRVESDSQ